MRINRRKYELSCEGIYMYLDLKEEGLEACKKPRSIKQSWFDKKNKF